jgi:biopolymer transport protein ExbB
MLEYFVKGGFLMYPILLCSIISLTIIIERLIFYATLKINPVVTHKIFELVSNKEFEKSKKLAETLPNVVKSIFIKGIDEYYTANFEEVVEEIAEQQVYKLNRFLPLLGAIASISTLLGFTGTVTGMIKAFESIAQAGYASPQVVAKGIAEALITTAAGLIVAIPTISFYHYFTYRADRFVTQLEHIVNEFVKLNKKV